MGERVHLCVFGFLCFYCLVDVAVDNIFSTLILSGISMLHTVTLTYILVRHRDADIHESYHNKDVIVETSKMAFTALVGEHIADRSATSGAEAEEDDDDQFDDEAGGVAAADEMIDGVFQGIGDA